MNTNNLECPKCERTEWKIVSIYLQCNYCEQLIPDYRCNNCGTLIVPSKCQVQRGQSNQGGGQSDCFITSACCEAISLADDCYELERFRDFRDSWLQKQEDGALIINEYYVIAPKIVESIRKKEFSNEIFYNIWERYLKDCLTLIEDGSFEKCKSLYIEMIEALKYSYLYDN
jgi:hypothetical protein